MAKYRFWFAVLGVCCAAMVVCGCESVDGKLGFKKPTAKLAGLSLDEVKIDSATLLFDVEVKNPYPVALPLTNLDYELWTGDNNFLSGAAPIQGTIAAGSTETVVLPAKINYLQMLKALKQFSPGATIPYKANVGLSVDPPAVSALRLPLKKEGELKLPTLDATSLQGLLERLK